MRTFYIISACFLFACQQPTKSADSKNISNYSDNKSLQTNFQKDEFDTIAAKDWLEKAIIEHFDGTNSDMKEITIPEYYEFKMDAMNVNLDTEGSLTKDEFKKKWQKIYKPNVHPLHVGFLISGQDWGNISVQESIVKNVDKTNKTIIFRTVIRDDEFRISYNRDIVIIQNEQQYLIADVWEYD